MKKLILLLVVLVSATVVVAQVPVGNPIVTSTGRYKIGYLQQDSAGIAALRDTLWNPRYPGSWVYWRNPGVDSAFWVFNGRTTGQKWDKVVMIGQNNPGPVPASRSIFTTYPLMGGGDLSIDRTHRIDTGRSGTQIVTGGDLNKVRDSLQANITGSVSGVSSVNGTGALSFINQTTTPLGTIDTAWSNGLTTRKRTRQISDSIIALNSGSPDYIPRYLTANSTVNSNAQNVAGRWLFNGVTDDGITLIQALGGLRLGTNITATSGLVKLPNDSAIKWRNAANNADIGFNLTANDRFGFEAGVDVNGTILSNDTIRGRYVALTNGTASQVIGANGLPTTAGSNISISGNVISATGLIAPTDTAAMLSWYPRIFGRTINNFFKNKTIEFDGNSITAGANASTFDSSYAPRVATALGISYVDSALGGSIVRNGIYRQFKNASPTNPMTNYSAAFGINDVRAFTAVNLTVGVPNMVTGIVEGLKTIVANRFMDSIRAASTLTQGGTWSTLSSSNNLSSKSLLQALGNPLKSTSSGSTLSYSVSLNKGQSIVIGTWGDTAATTLGSFSVTIDGVLFGSYNAANKANAYQYSVLAPTFDWRLPNVFIASGLSAGVHSVVITTLSNLEVDIDYVGKMVTPQNASGVLLSHVLQMTDYSIPLAGSATGARVDSVNNNIDTLVGYFNKMGYYTIGAVATENYYNTANAPSDGLHPNNFGHTQVANAFIDKIQQLEAGNIYFGSNGVEINSNKTVTLVSPTINQKTQQGLNTNFNGNRGYSSYNQYSIDKIPYGYVNWGVNSAGANTGTDMIYTSVGRFQIWDSTGAGIAIHKGNTILGGNVSDGRDKLVVTGTIKATDTVRALNGINTTFGIFSGAITGTTLNNALLGGVHAGQTLVWNNVFSDGLGPYFSGGNAVNDALTIVNSARDTIAFRVKGNGNGTFFGTVSGAFNAGSAGNFVVNNSGTLATRTANQVATDIGAVTTASNGLTATSGDIKLGGVLTQNTTVTDSTFYLLFDNQKKFNNSSRYGLNGNLNMYDVQNNDASQLIYAGLYGSMSLTSPSNVFFHHAAMYAAVNGTSYFNQSGNITGSPAFAGLSSWNLFAGSGNLANTAGLHVKTPEQQAGATAFSGKVTTHGGITIDNLRDSSSIQSKFQNMYAIHQKGANDTNKINGPIFGGIANFSGLITGQNGISLTGTSGTLLNTISTSVAGGQALIFHNASATGYGPYVSGGNATNDALTVVDYTRATTALNVKGDGKAYNGQNSTTFFTVSDARVKEKIEPLGKALETVNKLNPVRYDYEAEFAKKRKWDDGKRLQNIGFIAQEWEKVFPRYTTTSADSVGGGRYFTDLKGVDLTPLGPLNTAAIKEMYQLFLDEKNIAAKRDEEYRAEIESLKAEIKALKKK